MNTLGPGVQSDFTPWFAPAKLNLFLRITGRRADGYHELQTVFQLLDYGDEVRLRVRYDGRLQRLSRLDGVPPARDLVMRAAALLQERTGTSLGADVFVEKRIPMGAGLGGGSSSAASTLSGLNRLWDLRLSLDELAELGLALGADVPVFVRGRSGWAEGLGQLLTPLELEKLWYLVIFPNCSVSTAEVFSAPDLTRNSPPLKIRDLLGDAVPGAARRASVLHLLEKAGNDCEAVARGRFRQVDDALQWLSRAGQARMTGTGASVFAPFVSQSEALQTLAQVPGGWRAFVARGVNRSPLLSERDHSSLADRS